MTTWLADALRPLASVGRHQLWLLDCKNAPDSLVPLLPLPDQQRWQRYRFTKHRRRFAARRSALRFLLANHLDLPISQLQVTTSEHGKPILPDHPCHFNLSHSGESALFALGPTPVGVDLERLPGPDDWQQLMPLVLAPSERRTAHTQTEFLRYWVAKEALLKAIGLGLGIDLPALALRLSPTTATIDSMPPDLGPASWHLHFLPIPSAIAAICIVNDCLIDPNFVYQVGINDSGTDL